MGESDPFLAHLLAAAVEEPMLLVVLPVVAADLLVVAVAHLVVPDLPGEVAFASR